MKNLTHHAILITSLLVGTSVPLYAQQGSQQGYQQGQQGQQGYQQGQQGLGDTNQWSEDHHGRREQWKAFREELAQDIKTRDAELEQLAAQMTNSPPAQKLDAVSAVVGKLVEDRLEMHRKLEAMHEQMHGTNMPMDTNDTNVLTPPSLPGPSQ